jgi:hypothetical protein
MNRFLEKSNWRKMLYLGFIAIATANSAASSTNKQAGTGQPPIVFNPEVGRRLWADWVQENPGVINPEVISQNIHKIYEIRNDSDEDWTILYEGENEHIVRLGLKKVWDLCRSGGMALSTAISVAIKSNYKSFDERDIENSQTQKILQI